MPWKKWEWGGPGERNRNARLTEDAVREIKASKRTKAQADRLGKKYGVLPKYIRQIWRGYRWRHVEDEDGKGTKGT